MGSSGINARVHGDILVKYPTDTTISIMKAALFVFAILALSFADAKPKGLACDICIDVMTDLDNFLTDDTTQEEVVAFAKELCHLIGTLLGETVEAQCNTMFEENLPAIIDAIVEGNLDPTAVCTTIGACP